MSNDSMGGAGAEWWRTAVVYEVYPRSFADGNGDGIGDLAGVRSRLGYLRDLGVDALWFTPWYVSPLADGGYDVEDYRRIDPVFGDLAEAEALIAEARELGIRTIVDIVPNHVSERHPWFVEALASAPGSEARERFWFHPGAGPDGSGLPTRWKNNFAGDVWTRTRGTGGGQGDAAAGHAGNGRGGEAEEWYLHLFAPEQPDLNWEHPDVAREHLDILRFWFDRGVAGIRIDSAAHIIKDPSFPEDDGSHAPGDHPNLDRDGVHEVYRDWRRVADSYADPKLLVGEVWLPDTERFAAYLAPDEMHTAFNFDLMTRPWRREDMRASIDLMLGAHAAVGAPCTWVLSNHDVTRPVTRYGREDSSFSFDTKAFGIPTDLVLGERRARAAALLVAALPGSLYLYQGDELGLPEVEDLDPAELQDPMFERSGGTNPGRDGCRVPLPWSGGAAPFGFTADAAGSDATGSPAQPAARPWLTQPPSWSRLTVEAQLADPASMLTLYRRSLHLRRSLPEFASEDFAWLDLGDSALAFRRGGLVSVTNFGPDQIPLPAGTEILLSSVELPAGSEGAPPIPADATVWLRSS